MLYWLEQFRNCKTQNHCRALGNRRGKKPELLYGRAHFMHPTMWKTWWRQESGNADGMSQRILQHTDLQHVIYHMSVIVLFR